MVELSDCLAMFYEGSNFSYHMLHAHLPSQIVASGSTRRIAGLNAIFRE